MGVIILLPFFFKKKRLCSFDSTDLLFIVDIMKMNMHQNKIPSNLDKWHGWKLVTKIGMSMQCNLNFLYQQKKLSLKSIRTF